MTSKSTPSLWLSQLKDALYIPHVYLVIEILFITRETYLEIFHFLRKLLFLVRLKDPPQTIWASYPTFGLVQLILSTYVTIHTHAFTNDWSLVRPSFSSSSALECARPSHWAHYTTILASLSFLPLSLIVFYEDKLHRNAIPSASFLSLLLFTTSFSGMTSLLILDYPSTSTLTSSLNACWEIQRKLRIMDIVLTVNDGILMLLFWTFQFLWWTR